jgi:hypothetical protein
MTRRLSAKGSAIEVVLGKLAFPKEETALAVRLPPQHQDILSMRDDDTDSGG